MMLESRPLSSLLGSQNVGLWREPPQEINTHQTAKINTFITPRRSLQRATTSMLLIWLEAEIHRAHRQKLPSNTPLTEKKKKKTKVTGLAFLNNWARRWQTKKNSPSRSKWTILLHSPGVRISSEENAPSVVPLLQIKNRRLSNYGALSPRNVSLLHFKLCSERWQTNDRFNFYQEEKHMAGANEVSSLILPLTETIWTK